MSVYNGWTAYNMPAYPAAPASVEFQRREIVAVSTSAFTGQQQVQDFNARFAEASISYAPIPYAYTSDWRLFFQLLHGPLAVFQFSSTFCDAFPEFKTDGGSPTPRWWRLKGDPKWTISKGKFYGVTFEIREAI